MKKNYLYGCILMICLYVFPPTNSYAFLGIFGESYIDMVREGTYSFDNSLTLGDALEGNKFIKNAKWEIFEDSQKRNFVIFTSDIDSSVFNTINFDRDVLQRLVGSSELEFMNVPINLRIEFKISKDNSFNVSFLEISNEIESLIKPSTVDGAVEVIKTLYENDIPASLLINLHVLSTSGLIDAISDNNLEKIRLLIEYGANPQKTQRRISPLVEASSSGSVDAVKILLENGADPNRNENVNTTPLLEAIKSNKLDNIRVLLENGANPNTIVRGDYPINLAIRRGNIDIIDALLHYGADVNMKLTDDMGEEYTPFHYAIRMGNSAVVKFLLENGADFKVKYSGYVDPIVKSTVEEFIKEYYRNLENNNSQQEAQNVNAAGAKNVKTYSLDLEHSGASANVTIISDKEIILELSGGSSNGSYTCYFQGKCKVEDSIFKCTDTVSEGFISGKVTKDSFEIFQDSNASGYCGMGGSINVGKYVPDM